MFLSVSVPPSCITISASPPNHDPVRIHSISTCPNTRLSLHRCMMHVPYLANGHAFACLLITCTDTAALHIKERPSATIVLIAPPTKHTTTFFHTCTKPAGDSLQHAVPQKASDSCGLANRC